MNNWNKIYENLKDMKTFKIIIKRINCLLCDLAIIYALFYLLMFVRPVGFPIIAYFFCSFILYFGLSYGLFHASFMQKLFGIEIKKRHLNHFLLKLLWIAIVPLALSIFQYFLFLALYLLVIFVLEIVLLIFTKKSLWQLCSRSQIELHKVPYCSRSIVSILLTVSVVLLFFPLFQLNLRLDINEHILSSKSALPVSIPEKKFYVKNIRQYKEDPINYIMQLFETYDIVILCERLHPEYTQWEFFSELILNEIFARKVQNVFTEVGDVQDQEQLDNYLNTHFAAEEDLQRATAKIVRESGCVWPIWSNTNIYDFILRLHQYNEAQDNMSRINLFFTDMYLNWDEIENPSKRDSIIVHTNRDSIMAYNIINQFNKLKNQKCLLITNTRHAWNIGKNEAAYIFEKFPDKTAAVLINGTAQLLYPAMNGTLDAAALEVTDDIWAIDFKNCPIGNTHWDLFPSHKLNNLRYRDLFVGMIYCKHPSNWIVSHNYPFILDNYEDTLLERSALVGEKYFSEIKNRIEKKYYGRLNKYQCELVKQYNLLFLIIHSVILLFLSLNLFIKLRSLFFNKKTS